MKKKTRKSTRILAIALAMLMMFATLALTVGAESLSGQGQADYPNSNAYSETRFSCTTSKSGGLVNATLGWDGTSFTAWYGVSPADADYVIHEDWLIFNGSDDPVSGGTWTARATSDAYGSNLTTAESVRTENDGDTLVHRFQQNNCWKINVSYSYSVTNKDFVTEQDMETRGWVCINGTVYSMVA